MTNKEIKQLRKTLNLTQEQFAKQMDYSLSHYKAVELGYRPAGRKLIKAINNLIKERNDK